MKCKWKYNNNGSPDAIMLTVSTNVILWMSKLKNIIFDIYIYIYIKYALDKQQQIRQANGPCVLNHIHTLIICLMI